jgi:hypothetical protein
MRAHSTTTCAFPYKVDFKIHSGDVAVCGEEMVEHVPSVDIGKANHVIIQNVQVHWFKNIDDLLFQSLLHVKLSPLPQPQLCARTYAETNPSTQGSTQLRSVLACVCSVSRQNLNTITVP